MSEFKLAETKIKPGLSVIEASAGTGKTYTVTHLVPRLLLEGTVEKLEHILLVTYTNDAAGELAEKVRAVLEKLHAPAAGDEAETNPDLHTIRREHGEKIPELIGRALLDIDRLRVSTIHSFCLRVLQDEGALCGLPVIPEIVSDIGEAVEEAVRDCWENELVQDVRLAALALAEEWKIDHDLQLALMAAGHDEYAFVPEPRNLRETLEAIERCRLDMKQECIDELAGFIARVPEDLWNADAGDEISRQGHVANLSAETPMADWLAAAKWIACTPLKSKGLINGVKTAGKTLISEAAALPAVKIAAEAAALAGEIKWAWQTHCARAATQNARARMEADRRITYDGLISRVRHALCDSPHRNELARRLRERYKVALVDESQDTDPRQFDIFRTIFLGSPGDDATKSHRLVLVGDPKQAIYAFRGADLNTYLQARNGADGDQVFTLSRTFRAPPKLVRATNAFFTRDGSFLNPEIRMQPATAGHPDDVFLDEGAGADAPRIEVWLVEEADGGPYENAAERSDNLAKGVAVKIANLLQSRAVIAETRDGKTSTKTVEPGDFAVLVNSNHEARKVRDALGAAGVPSVTAAGMDIMGSEEAADLIAVLQALTDPRRRKLRFGALATRLLGRTASQLREIARTEDAMLGVFDRWSKILANEGVAAAVAAIDADERVSERLAATDGGERRLTNLRQLTDLLQREYELHGKHAARMLRWAAKEKEDANEQSRTGVEERQQQLESDARAVKIATMHSAKGLEFPLVFCPFLWNRGAGARGELFRKFMPEPGAVKLVRLAKCDPATKVAMDKARFEERLRLAYVAMTRARVKLWIHAGAAGETGPKTATALDWLLRRDGETSLEDVSAEDKAAGRDQRQKTGLASLIATGGAAEVLADTGAPSLQDAAWGGGADNAGPLADAEPAPVIPETWSMTSFSSLTREKNPKGDDAPPQSGGDETEPAADAPANAFLDAPAGALVGTAIHDWMESWDFSAPRAAAVQEHLRHYALAAPKEGASWPERVVSMLGDLRGSRLPGFDCIMAEACAEPAASEWHFQLPLETRISPKKLADIFARHGEEDYAALLETLPEAELEGYLHGFIDRIAVDPQTQKWGVIDWKTNKLGTSVAAHRKQSSLLRCAKRSHYFLQMHLYLVALRRFLGPAAAPDDAWLVFLRGVRDGTADGILHIKPAEKLLRDLGNLFRNVRTA